MRLYAESIFYLDNFVEKLAPCLTDDDVITGPLSS